MSKTNEQLGRLLHEEGVISTRVKRRIEAGDYPEPEDSEGEEE